MANSLHIFIVITVLAVMKLRVKATVSQCRDEIIYSTLSTFAGVGFIMVICFILYTTIKRRRQKTHRNKATDIEGRRNKVYENDVAVERDGNITTDLNTQVTLRKSQSTPDLSSKRVASDIASKEEAVAVNAQIIPLEKKCACTQTEEMIVIKEVVVEKKTFNSSGLDFALAGVFIRNIDHNEIAVKEGEIHSGDEVVAINGIQMNGMNDMEAFSCFARSGPTVKLTLSKYNFLHKVQQENTITNGKEKSVIAASTVGTITPETTVVNVHKSNDIETHVQANQITNDVTSDNRENIMKKYDINQNIVPNNDTESSVGKRHGKSRSAEEHSTTCNGYITDHNKISASGLQPSNLLVATARLHKSFDTNGNHFEIQNRYFKRARSEENLRPHKSNSFSRSRVAADLTMSYGDYIRQVSLLQANKTGATLSNDSLYSMNQNSLLGGEKVVLQRGYNQDYITPINGSFSTLHLPRLPQSRINSQAQALYNLNGDSSECLDCVLQQQKSNEESPSFQPSYDKQLFPSTITNSFLKSDDNGLLFQNKENIELDPDVMRYMTQKYSEPRLQRKDPPPYSSTHNTISQTLTSQANVNNVECTVIKRHPQKRGVVKQRPHSYTEAVMLKAENENNSYSEQTNHVNDENEQEKRKHPKRAHSMPAVKHLEGRPKVAKTFLENEPKQKTNTRKSRQRNKAKQEEMGRRKSIDSGTLQKLANEIQSDPKLEDEFPFISKLLGGGQLSPAERRNSTLFRHKSTEELCSQF